MVWNKRSGEIKNKNNAQIWLRKSWTLEKQVRDRQEYRNTIQ
jgi:hypothetical protein